MPIPGFPLIIVSTLPSDCNDPAQCIAGAHANLFATALTYPPATWIITTVFMKDLQSTRDSFESIREAAALIREARYLTAFTGAGISVESGIPPFRGPGGLWGKYHPRTLEIEYFLRHPEQAWPVIKEIFYDNFGKARPNHAHEVLAAWERDGWPRGAGSSERGFLKVLITQNIDNLHYMAGSRTQ